MKISILIASLFFLSVNFAQKSEMLVPQDAVTVFSINNISLLQKISLDELIKYEFMAEVQQEIFDGSTAGRTLKDSGFDFDQKFNVFYGKGRNYEISGFTFGIENKQQLFEVFDDFQLDDSNYPGVSFYSSFSNRIAIKDNSGLLFRVTPNMSLVDEMTDSIWFARGFDYPWYTEFDEGDFYEETESSYEDEFVFEEIEVEFENEVDDSLEGGLPLADEDPTIKTYYELRDSVDMVLQLQFMKKVCDELFIHGNNLIKYDADFKNQLSHPSEGIFYMDNSRSFQKQADFWYLEHLYPRLFKNVEELYADNKILGDLYIKDQSVELHLDAHYNEKLGSIYEKLSSSKFDKNVLKYIHRTNDVYFTYNVNLKEAYEQAYDILIPILSQEDDKRISANLLLLDLLNEYVNKDAIFDTYKGSMFGAYNGIQKIKTKKIIFEYDEENFEYLEREVEAEEDMPIFTLGFTTDRADLTEKIMNHITRISSSCKKMENYWVFQNAILNSAPLYLINKNGLFIFTNDENLANSHANGYGKQAISKKKFKKAIKGGVVYAYADLGRAIENLPRGLFNDRENEVLNVVRGKSGTVEFTSSKTTKDHTAYDLVYKFEGQYSHSGTYILDLINSLYVISQ